MKPLLFTDKQHAINGIHMIYKAYSQAVKGDDIYRFTVRVSEQNMKWIVLQLGEVTDIADRWVWFLITCNNTNIDCVFGSSDTVGVEKTEQWEKSKTIEDTYTFANGRNWNANVVLDYNVVASIHIGRQNSRYFRYIGVIGQGHGGFQIKAESAEKFWQL